MAISSAHPELNQPLPRCVKAGPNFLLGITFMPVGFLILAAPFFNVALGQFRKHSLQPYLLWALSLIVFLYFVSMACLLWAYFKEKKLLMWGSLAEALISEGPEMNGGKGIRYMDVNYGFEDADGNSVVGTRKFPARIDEDSQNYLSKLERPIVIYDPKNSSRHLLYPSRFTICYPPEQAQ